MCVLYLVLDLIDGIGNEVKVEVFKCLDGYLCVVDLCVK